MKIKTILATKSPNILSVGPDQTLKEAIALLVKHNIGAVLVLDGDAMSGILSERDVMRALSADANVHDQPVRAVMTGKVVTGTPQDDLHAVMRTMTDGRFRHLPILDNGALVGIISIGDLVHWIIQSQEQTIHELEGYITGDYPH